MRVYFVILICFFRKSIFYWLGKKWPLWQTLNCNLHFMYIGFSCTWHNVKYFQPRNFTVSKQQHMLYLMICEWFPVCIYVPFWFCFCALLACYFSHFIWWCCLVVQCLLLQWRLCSDSIMQQQTNKLNHCRLKM